MTLEGVVYDIKNVLTLKFWIIQTGMNQKVQIKMLQNGIVDI